MDSITPEPMDIEAPFDQGSLSETKQTVAIDAGKNVSDKTAVGKFVMNAIRLSKDQSGTSLRDIKKVLESKHQLDVKDKDTDIKLFLNNAINCGVLTKLDGKYKVAERARRRRSKKSGGKKRSRSRKRRSASAKGGKGSRKRSSRRRKRRSPKA